MEGRAIVKTFFDELLETLDHLRRDVWIKLDVHSAVSRILHLDDGNFRIRHRLDARLEICISFGIGILRRRLA